MDNACYCDFDPPSVCHVNIRKARKKHVCSECESIIAPGEQYEHVWGVWDGWPNTNKTCCRCLALRDHLDDLPCFCWSYGGLLEQAREEIIEMMGDDTGFRFRALRLLLAIRRGRGYV